MNVVFKGFLIIQIWFLRAGVSQPLLHMWWWTWTKRNSPTHHQPIYIGSVQSNMKMNGPGDGMVWKSSMLFHIHFTAVQLLELDWIFFYEFFRLIEGSVLMRKYFLMHHSTFLHFALHINTVFLRWLAAHRNCFLPVISTFAPSLNLKPKCVVFQLRPRQQHSALHHHSILNIQKIRTETF